MAARGLCGAGDVRRSLRSAMDPIGTGRTQRRPASLLAFVHRRWLSSSRLCSLSQGRGFHFRGKLRLVRIRAQHSIEIREAAQRRGRVYEQILEQVTVRRVQTASNSADPPG